MANWGMVASLRGWAWASDPGEGRRGDPPIPLTSAEERGAKPLLLLVFKQATHFRVQRFQAIFELTGLSQLFRG